MLSRHNEEADGVELPEEWLNEVTLAVTSTYGDSISLKGYEIKAFGELHKGEVCVAFCVSAASGCITLMLSIDLDKKQEPKEVLDKTINQSSEFFDLIINNQGNDIFQPNWMKSDLKNAEFFFKITREDISLTIEANRLLRDS